MNADRRNTAVECIENGNTFENHDCESIIIDKKDEEVIKSDSAVARKTRERRLHQSPLMVEPLSPSSSSSASHSATDVTFEPTIDMMVNDFDDEQTLNEEEALAELESQDVLDEIATLQEEGEMPLEELLAKYRAKSPPTPPIQLQRKKIKKAISSTKRTKSSYNIEKDVESRASPEDETNGQADVIVIESGDEETTTEQQIDDEAALEKPTNIEEISNVHTFTRPFDQNKARRSHLFDLYPEQSFTTVVTGAERKVALNMLYEEDDEDEDEEVEADSDYVKKTIMVGTAYQAAIPVGLSQYGDVLPYENEDKLIWEPSQVNEREVEEYLIQSRDIKAALNDEEPNDIVSSSDEIIPKNPAFPLNVHLGILDNDTSKCLSQLESVTENQVTSPVIGGEGEMAGVIKDNEQALHLLVQCGYDFKEALRRKRLHAVPLTGSMSLWSEEECHKFEEGIQKFGKDFLKIRQNQVRTRSMRELVQFYYLWKKSERRDHDFANSDTVDHMDIYLNEGGDYGPKTAVATLPGASNTTTPTAFATRRTQKTFSIMTGSNVTSNTSNHNNIQSNTTGASKQTSNNRKRVTATIGGSSGNLLTSNNTDHPNLSTSVAFSK